MRENRWFAMKLISGNTFFAKSEPVWERKVDRFIEVQLKADCSR